MTIYMDAIWLLNFFFDFLLLLLTQILARNDTSKWRIICGALIASFIVPITIYFPSSFFTTTIGKLIYSIFIIFTAFRFSTIHQFIKLFLLFYFITFTIGGGLIAIHYLFLQNAMQVFTVSPSFGDPISWLFVLIGFPIIWLFTKRRMDKHVTEKLKYDELCPVKVQIDSQIFSTMGFIDSGNHLVDPLTKIPVIICDELFIKQFFNTDDWQMLHESWTHFDLTKLPAKWKKRIQIVPYKGVKGHSDLLYVIRPDQLTITYQTIEMVTKKVLIGIQFARLTKDKQYQCLLQPQIIQTASIKSA